MHAEKFTIRAEPAQDKSFAECFYDSVTLEVLAIYKDFTAARGNKGGDSSITLDLDEEYLTYPIAIACFEDANFARFLRQAPVNQNSDEDVNDAGDGGGALRCEIEHSETVFGYVVRLKHSIVE